MRLVETHCHLDYLKSYPMEEILNLCQTNGVEKIVTISVEPDNLDSVLAIAEAHSHIYCTQGVHPHDADKITEECLEKIRSRTKHPKVVAVGEIGLDFHYNHSVRETQIKRFEEQMQIAHDSNLPVVIHTRDADPETMSILRNFSGKLPRKGVLHSFTSGKALAEYALSEGFVLGFNGIITFPKAEDVREVLRLTPVNQILFETDSPFLTPVPHRGKENGPYFLAHVMKKIAEIKGISEDELCRIVWDTTHHLFNLK
ncbi:MAG: TatD family hydrolase [Bacteriovoracaceae bacterium]